MMTSNDLNKSSHVQNCDVWFRNDQTKNGEEKKKLK